MKKTLVCMAVLCAMMSAATASYAASYNTQENKVTSTAASDNKAVIIVKGDESTVPADDNIVYVNQTNTSFGATADFLIKSSPAEGLYTVMYGGTGSKTTETFYIGVGDLAGDTQMELVGSSAFTGTDGKTTYSMGYTATVNVADYKSVIIKKSDNTYMGCNIPTALEGDGTVKIGIQINGAESASEISGVWISKMVVNGATASSADSQ